jgi:hypothetical protein
MTSQGNFVPPPRVAVWLAKLFTPPEEAESVQGDLLEEYSDLASHSGVGIARKWYWRQSLKTIAQFAGMGFRVAPWSTAAAVVGGYLLLRLVSGLPERAIFAVLHRYRVFEHHFDTYVFFASDGIAIGHVITSLFVGCMVALATKGREMVATMTLALVLFGMGGAAYFWLVARTGNESLLWMLPWYVADWLAIVVGGAIVRTRRQGEGSHAFSHKVFSGR